VARYSPADMSVWTGRVDVPESVPARRWHQVVQAWDGQRDLAGALTILGFRCDEGVRRNAGRVGAVDGPAAIRRALAGLAYSRPGAVFDAGDVSCDDADLEAAQDCLAGQVEAVLKHGGLPLVFGGGHEVAWGGFCGAARYLQATAPSRRLGIVNFDAHFDLRDPVPVPNSGTPFRQVAQWCTQQGRPFHYAVIGISPAANTAALFETARDCGVLWFEDMDCRVAAVERALEGFLRNIDDLYLTVCLDVFPAAVAPGVSAPAALGVEPAVVMALLRRLGVRCREQGVVLRLVDIAEMNPRYDPGGRTAALAARLVHEITTVWG